MICADMRRNYINSNLKLMCFNMPVLFWNNSQLMCFTFHSLNWNTFLFWNRNNCFYFCFVFQDSILFKKQARIFIGLQLSKKTRKTKKRKNNKIGFVLSNDLYKHLNKFVVQLGIQKKIENIEWFSEKMNEEEVAEKKFVTIEKHLCELQIANELVKSF
jgi:hypothetical protein